MISTGWAGLRLWLGIPLFATSVAAATYSYAAPDGSGRPMQFGEWIVGCDNTRACDLVSSDTGQTIAFRVHRESSAAAMPSIEFVMVEGADDAIGKGLSIRVDGREPLQVETTTSRANGLSTRLLSNSRQIAEVLTSILPARSLAVNGLGQHSTTFSLTGLRAASRWADVQQGRAGTSSALVAIGPSSDPIATSTPAPLIGPPGSIGKVAPQEVARLEESMFRQRPSDPDMSADCYGANGDSGVDPSKASAYSLTANLTILLLACDGGAYNQSFSLFAIDPTSGKPTTVVIDDGSPYFSPADDAKTVPQVSNPTIDPATATLTQNFKDRAQGDCGWSTTWLWDGTRFVLAGSSAMPACRGLTFPEWITTYVTRLR